MDGRFSNICRKSVALLMQAPDGSSKTFRCATETADVPAQTSERVTFVSCPFKNSRKGSRPLIFSATPPGRLPGEAMQASLHIVIAFFCSMQPVAPLNSINTKPCRQPTTGRAL
jgi:hypothetical protein